MVLAALIPVVVLSTLANAASATVTTGMGRTYGGPGHTFSVASGAPGGSLVRSWSKTFGGWELSPLVVGSAVVTATTSSGDAGMWVDVQAFDGVTGTPLWPPLALEPAVASMTSDGQRIFVLTGESVVAIDLATGRELWTNRVSPGVGFTTAATVFGGLLWVNNGNNALGLAALDPATGAVVSKDTAAGGTATMALVGHTLYDAICAYDLSTRTARPVQRGYCGQTNALNEADTRVVVSPAYNDFSHLTVRDLTSGATLWSAPAGWAALDNGRLLVATSHRQFSSLDELTGKQRWTVTLPARPAAPPLVFNGTAAVVGADGHLRRYSTATGALIDDNVLAGSPVFLNTELPPAPAADSGLLVVPSGRTLTVFHGSTTGLPAAATAASRQYPAVPATATGTDRADGSQYAEDAGHDGVAQGSTLTSPLHLAWTKMLPGTASNALVTSTGQMFVASANPGGGFDVYRLNRRTGAVLWGPVHLTGGINLTTVHLALSAGILVDYETGGSSSSALLHGLNPSTGAVLWTTGLAQEVYGYDGYPTISSGTVYVHCHDDRYGGLAWALDLSTGKVRWTSVVMKDMASFSPAAGAGLVYYGGAAAQLYALNPATGQQAYHVDSTEDGGDNSSTVYAGSRVYVNDFGGGGVVVNAAIGQLTGTDMFAMHRPAVNAAAHVMVAIQGNRVTAESLTDRTRYWTYTDTAIPSLSPVIANGLVLTGDNSGRLMALSEKTGALLWSDPNAYAPTTANILQGTEPAQLAVGAGAVALTSGNQLRVYAGAIDNGPTP